MLKVWIKHVLCLVETVYFIVVRYRERKLAVCPISTPKFLRVYPKSNFEWYVSEKTQKQRATCL